MNILQKWCNKESAFQRNSEKPFSIEDPVVVCLGTALLFMVVAFLYALLTEIY